MMHNTLDNTRLHSRLKPRKPDLRGDYFRDQTAIIHAQPFRRLKHKTQVFFAPENDHVCTRIEHVLHVSTIATTLCKGLGLDGEMAQAIALGHDLGHAPFGHPGERSLDELAKANDLGRFIHEVHSLRVVDRITRDGRGLNLTYAVRDGIVSHCGEHFQQVSRPETREKDLNAITNRQAAPLTYEGCVVRMADKIAYLGRDIEDAISTGLITKKDVPDELKRTLGSTNGEIIDTLVMDVVDASKNSDAIAFSDQRYQLFCRLKDFNYERIYNHPRLKESDTAINNLIHSLYHHLDQRFRQYGEDGKAYQTSPFRVDQRFWTFFSKRKTLYADDAQRRRCVIDFVAGMTDHYALQAAHEILFPRPIAIR